MHRRKMLKVLPLAVMAGASVKLGEVEAKAFEMKPYKKYVFVMLEASKQDVAQVGGLLRARGVNATVVSGAGLTIYEIEQSVASNK